MDSMGLAKIENGECECHSHEVLGHFAPLCDCVPIRKLNSNNYKGYYHFTSKIILTYHINTTV